jgi:hypothetical protein
MAARVPPLYVLTMSEPPALHRCNCPRLTSPCYDLGRFFTAGSALRIARIDCRGVVPCAVCIKPSKSTARVRGQGRN